MPEIVSRFPVDGARIPPSRLLGARRPERPPDALHPVVMDSVQLACGFRDTASQARYGRLSASPGVRRGHLRRYPVPYSRWFFPGCTALFRQELLSHLNLLRV